MSYHAQFKDIPPIDDVKELFVAATGLGFHTEATWTLWWPVDIDLVLSLRPYIRPSHQKILLETARGKRNACALLRQLLRPHGYRITQFQHVWTVLEHKDDVKTVCKHDGTTVNWST